MKKYTTLRRLNDIQTFPRDLVIKGINKLIDSEFDPPFSLHRLRRRILDIYPDPFMRIAQLLERNANGFTVSDAWDAGNYMSKLVGEMLLQLKEAGNSHPTYYSYEAWQAQLEYHGNILIKDDDDLPDDIEEALEAEKELANAKRDSMYWVADHLGTLWD